MLELNFGPCLHQRRNGPSSLWKSSNHHGCMCDMFNKCLHVAWWMINGNCSFPSQAVAAATASYRIVIHFPFCFLVSHHASSIIHHPSSIIPSPLQNYHWLAGWTCHVMNMSLSKTAKRGMHGLTDWLLDSTHSRLPKLNRHLLST